MQMGASVCCVLGTQQLLSQVNILNLESQLLGTGNSLYNLIGKFY